MQTPAFVPVPSGEFKRQKSLQKTLLFCGIVSSIWYVAVNIIVPLQYPGYNAATQTVSELSAIGAPTRPLWILLISVYNILIIAFGWGLRQQPGAHRYLRTAGLLLIIYAIIGIFWPPMHQREALAVGQKGLTDTLHIVFTFVTVPLMLLVVGFTAMASGKKFRFYSVITLLIILGFGVLTGLQAPELEANQPTPWMGMLERVSIGAYMTWIAVLSVLLLRGDWLVNHKESFFDRNRPV